MFFFLMSLDRSTKGSSRRLKHHPRVEEGCGVCHVCTERCGHVACWELWVPLWLGCKTTKRNVSHSTWLRVREDHLHQVGQKQGLFLAAK